MATVETGTRVRVKNILFLTDFSEPSEAALPFAIAIAREYGATIHALHVLMPTPLVGATPELITAAIARQEESAQEDMQRIESQFVSLPQHTNVERGVAVWPSLERAIQELRIDLIVLGTHGRTGAQKLLMGSVAEEIFRRSRVPVLTIGPFVRSGLHGAAKFHRVLFATDFSPESLAAFPYAISMAQENEARLILLHVMREPDGKPVQRNAAESVADVMHRLRELVPPDAELWCRPEAVVQYGDAAKQILEVSRDRATDLVVLGVRDASGRLVAATHLAQTTAYRVVAHASCPVLTVRG